MDGQTALFRAGGDNDLTLPTVRLAIVIARRASESAFRSCAAAGFTTLFLVAAGCGGGGGGDDSSSPQFDFGLRVQVIDPNCGFVNRQNGSGFTFESPPTTTVCISGSIGSKQAISWSNSAGGSGQTLPDPVNCQFGVCQWSWSVGYGAGGIPLKLGINTFVFSTTFNGASQTQSLTITLRPDATPPTVTHVSPSNVSNVSVFALPQATFSESMDQSTLATSFQLATASGTSVSGFVTSTGSDATFHPSTSLAGLTDYVATITTGAKDDAGNSLVASRSWSFTTGVTPDTTPPTVTAVSPPDQSSCSPLEIVLDAEFSENVQHTTVTTNSFLLQDASLNKLNGTVTSTSAGSTSYRFTPTSRLPFNTTFTATLTTAIKDFAGNALVANKVWSFTTVPSGVGTWQPIAAIGARTLHSAVWTGTEMIIWGGFLQNALAPQIPWIDDGSRFNPTTNSWTEISRIGRPAPRYGHVAVWTGQEMLIWGGNTFQADSFTGARYNPATDTWQPMSSSGAGVAGENIVALWTGTEMIVIGSGGASRYNPTSDSWQPVAGISSSGINLLNPAYSAVWTGTRMIVWGSGEGASYDPSTDTWEVLPSAGAPVARGEHRAVWTGTEMIVFGGRSTNTTFFNSGGLYNPIAKTWRSMQSSCGPTPRINHTAVWTGSEMIVWGGTTQLGISNTGQRYDPQTDSWQQVSLTNAPSPNTGVTGVWTGTQMIIVGGTSRASYQP